MFKSITARTHTMLQARALRSRLRILESASRLFGEKGFDATSIRDVAGDAGVAVGLVCRYFPTREHLALAVYDRLADELASAAAELPPGTVQQRFRCLMVYRLRQCEEHRRVLTGLMGKALDPESRLHVFGPTVELTRARVHGAMGVVVRGAANAPRSTADAAELARLLYSLHLCLVLAALVEPTERMAKQLLDVADAGLRWALASWPLLRKVLGTKLEKLLFDRTRGVETSADRATTRAILERLFHENRVLPGAPRGLTPMAEALHGPRVAVFVRLGLPIELVLPAFPAKAPNPRKVLGPFPDLAEQVAVQRLSRLLDSLTTVWPAGARLTLCSDGHVFADVVGLSDDAVDCYRSELLQLIDDDRIRWFDLETAFGEGDPDRWRALLMERYATSTEALRKRARTTPSLRAQLDGIHRFLFEDEVVRRPDLPRAQARKQTRERAVEVVRRSEAWGALISAVFPQALRLSIHPQPDPSSKIGVHLVDVNDPWLTPWHSAAVVGREGVCLMHRADAEAEGARIIEENGRPWYLERA